MEYRRTTYMPAVIFLLLALFPCSVFGAYNNVDPIYKQRLDELYQHMSKYPSDRLVEMGQAMFQKRQEYDSAVVCLAIVKNRYKSHLPKREKELCIKATSGSGYISYYHYHDYSRAFDYFLQALQMGEETGYDEYNPRIYLNLGNLFINCSLHFHSSNMFKTAVAYYEKGLLASFRTKNWDMYVKNFITLSNAYCIDNDMEALRSLYDGFFYHEVPDTLRNYEVMSCHYVAMRELLAKQDEAAIARLEKEATMEIASLVPEHYRAMTFIIISAIYDRMGRTDDAIAAMARTLEIAREYRLVDFNATGNSRMADLYRAKGDERNFQTCYNRYVQAKDSLLSYYGLEMVGEKHFLSRLSQKEMASQEERQRIIQYFIVICILAAFVLGTIVFVFILRRKNRYLRERNRLLYEKFHDGVEAEAESEMIVKGGGKYRNSALTEEGKMQLVAAIKESLKDIDAICQPTFSVEQLAQMTNSNSRYVSQVINECFGMNFNSLVAEKRVREACRRFDNEADYGRMTIEAVAQSVGFRSRNSLISAFKKVTGLTPSEYQKMSKE